ncbi:MULTISPECIES: PLDc N-terminal domain-containing protein [unclassified Microbacterium]|uniref:PLDc N-terminal domain-containing protein n=1 Tax=unclassified Microbacterium TaxID=2609290 RepID=UPI000CFD2543|nr:hypothetical protein CQ047_07280 [Microbacterium sp. MYb72]
MIGLSAFHVLLIIAFAVVVIALDVLALIRIVRLREGVTGRVILWVLLILLLPVVGAIAVLIAAPKAPSRDSA